MCVEEPTGLFEVEDCVFYDGSYKSYRRGLKMQQGVLRRCYLCSRSLWVRRILDAPREPARRFPNRAALHEALFRMPRAASRPEWGPLRHVEGKLYVMVYAGHGELDLYEFDDPRNRRSADILPNEECFFRDDDEYGLIPGHLVESAMLIDSSAP